MSKANTTSEKNKESPETDHWGQLVIFHDDPATGAGERCECQQCGERLNVALVGGTDPNTESDKYEEFYVCQICGAKGTHRVNGSKRNWTGMMAYPEVNDR